MSARSTIAAYTDGLVERADRDIDEQIGVLKTQLSAAIAAGQSLEGTADQILAAFRPPSGEPNDDITLLLTRIPDRPQSIVAWTLDPVPPSARTARASVRQALAQWGYQELADTACLLVTEILTNAIRHARCPIKLTLCRAADELIIEVTDDSPQFPQRRLPDDDDEDGRGLVLVDALAAGWGTRPVVPGKTVWFTLRLPGAPTG